MDPRRQISAYLGLIPVGETAVLCNRTITRVDLYTFAIDSDTVPQRKFARPKAHHRLHADRIVPCERNQVLDGRLVRSAARARYGCASRLNTHALAARNRRHRGSRS